MKKTGQKLDMSAVGKRRRGELEEWHRKHEFDLVQMIEEKPELFRALLDQPSLFKGSRVGEKYCRIVSSAVNKAEKSTYYKESFISPRESVKRKDKLSIGNLVSTSKPGKRPKGKD